MICYWHGMKLSGEWTRLSTLALDILSGPGTYFQLLALSLPCSVGFLVDTSPFSSSPFANAFPDRDNLEVGGRSNAIAKADEVDDSEGENTTGVH